MRLLILLFSLRSFNIIAQPPHSTTIVARDKIYYTKKSTILLDGAIKDVTSSSADKSATGTFGIRSDGFFDRWDISFAAVSSTTPVQSNNVSDYSRMIVNPNLTSSGVALNFSMLKRNFTRKYTILNRLKSLLEQDSITEEVYDATLAKYPDLKEIQRKRLSDLRSHLGYLVEANTSNFTWINSSSTPQTLTGNVISLNYYFVYYSRPYFDLVNDYIEIFAGVGPSFRSIRGDVGQNHDFVNSILGTRKTDWLGAQATVQLYVKNLVGKAYYIGNISPEKISGFSGGQFFLSIGIQADIGSILTKARNISRMLRSDIPESNFLK